MHQATRACGPRSEMVPRASLSEELSQRRVLKWRRRSGVWAGGGLGMLLGEEKRDWERGLSFID